MPHSAVVVHVGDKISEAHGGMLLKSTFFSTAAALDSKNAVVHILLDEIAALKAAQQAQTESHKEVAELEARLQDLGKQLSEATASSNDAARRTVRHH